MSRVRGPTRTHGSEGGAAQQCAAPTRRRGEGSPVRCPPSPPDPGDLSRRLAQRRAELHLSQAQVAARAAGQAPEPVKTERLAALQALLQEQQRAFNRACVGQVLPVLFEKLGRHPGQLVGRSPYFQSVQKAKRPLLIRGSFSADEMRLLMDSLEPRGLFLNIMINSAQEAEALRPLLGM